MTALFVTLAALGGANEFLNPRQLRIEVCVLKGDPLGSRADGTVKCLAEPHLVCVNYNAASFKSGGNGTVEGADGMGGAKPFGIKLEFSPQIQPDGTIRLATGLEYSTRAPAPARLGNEQAVAAFYTYSSRHDRVVRPGEKFRIRIAADSAESQTWAEVTVTPVPAGK